MSGYQSTKTTTLPLIILWSLMISCLHYHLSPLYFMVFILDIQVVNSLLGGPNWRWLQSQGYSTCPASNSSWSCTSWITLSMQSSLRQKNLSQLSYYLSEYFLWLVVVWLWLVMLAPLSGNYFWSITLPPIKAPPSALTTSYLGGALRKSLMWCLTQIFPFLSSMIPFSNRGRFSRGGTRTWRHILTHHG